MSSLCKSRYRGLYSMETLTRKRPNIKLFYLPKQVLYTETSLHHYISCFINGSPMVPNEICEKDIILLLHQRYWPICSCIGRLFIISYNLGQIKQFCSWSQYEI